MIYLIEPIHLDGVNATALTPGDPELLPIGIPASRDLPTIQAQMRQMMNWGWQFLWKENYEKALYWYQTVFTYYHRYGSWNSELRTAYFMALYQYAWLKILKNEEDEAIKLFNSQLMGYLKTIHAPPQVPHNEEETIHGAMESLQHQGKLPSLSNRQAKPDPDTLVWLSQLMLQHNLKPQAQNLLRYAQVWESIRQVETAQKLAQLETGMTHVSPKKILERIPLIQWLPYAATQGPFPMEQRHSHPPESDLHDAMTLDELEGMLAVKQNLQQRDQNNKKRKR